ncbi:MAG: 1-(5-phosphoribosyl)-5-[(5-phosphoribosylamino)methylideneamino]imidazole-4-carboxamide isomerase [Burkholderiales bacterium]|nr:1-(5-phosphoribosyl)-5-[(5-phosphoribosylamino)methylideneamino]imidazole-4-carboxamide isomerase [Flavobacterium sp.]
MRIIPAIDILEGKCVRLSKGDYNTQKVYNENPLEVAKHFEAHGIQYLHLVDLDGARSGKLVNHKILSAIASKTALTIDFGGGLKCNEDLHVAFESGASQITGGSVAVKNSNLFIEWITAYGSKKIILGADVIPNSSGGEIAISGWQEKSKEAYLPFIKKYIAAGIEYVICTDISKDGMMEGPGLEIYRGILSNTQHLKLIASGGVTHFSDVLALAELGCEGAIIGKALYEGSVSLKQLEKFILKC